MLISAGCLQCTASTLFLDRTFYSYDCNIIFRRWIKLIRTSEINYIIGTVLKQIFEIVLVNTLAALTPTNSAAATTRPMICFFFIRNPLALFYRAFI